MTCYFIRTIYDALKVFQKDWFMAMRKDSYDQDSWHYAVFFFIVLSIAEVTPYTMLIYNLKHVLGNKVLLSPKLSVSYKKKE